jgi:hypothetical protein
MDLSETRAWFSSLSNSDKVIVLLIFMYEITILLRTVFLGYENDSETKSRLAYHLSEMNHAFTQAALALMEGKPTYPDDVLIEILIEHPSDPVLEPYCHDILGKAVQRLASKQQRRTHG